MINRLDSRYILAYQNHKSMYKRVICLQTNIYSEKGIIIQYENSYQLINLFTDIYIVIKSNPLRTVRMYVYIQYTRTWLIVSQVYLNNTWLIGLRVNIDIFHLYIEMCRKMDK